MSDRVPVVDIERIVEAKRHPTTPASKADTEEVGRG